MSATTREPLVRVIGGRLGGRRLRTPPGDVRPTSDRVREALFARLGDLEGARVLDLYAGSGALGIEAISRGATSATFVERSAAVAAALKANLAQLGIRDVAEVIRGDAKAVLRRLSGAGRRFDLVFADPPYGLSGEPARLLEALAAQGVLEEGARVVMETRKGVALPAVPGLTPLDERRYGDTVIHRLTAAPPAGERRGGDATMDEGPAPDGPGASRRERLALFAASFDPVTNGHLDLVQRARSVFPELVVAVARNVAKQGTFSADERLEMLRAVIGREPGIQITTFDGLLVDYAREIGARVLIRGLRAVSDFEYEFEMALMNRRLSPEIETLFMMTSQQFFYVSSSRLKELVRFGANVQDFVPAGVAEKLKEKLGGRL